MGDGVASDMCDARGAASWLKDSTDESYLSRYSYRQNLLRSRPYIPDHYSPILEVVERVSCSTGPVNMKGKRFIMSPDNPPPNTPL